MKDYSVQNFTFTKGRIFPNDWLQTKPYLTADAVDLYYVSLAMQGNKLYDKVYANKNALQFFVNPDAVSYKLACTVQDMGLVPDAFLNSIQGEEYGRKFLHTNGRFITDYYFHCCRQYDL